VTRPRLLFLCQTLPYPPDGGVKIRSYNILRLLAESFDVEALCFYRVRAGATTASFNTALAAMRSRVPTEAFPIQQSLSRSRLLLDHFRSVVARRAYTHFVYDSKQFEAAMSAKLAKCRFDIVHFDSMDLARFLPLAIGSRVACTHHNVESALLRDRSNWTKPRAKAAYLRHQAALVRRDEARLCPIVDLNITVSEEDAVALRAIAPSARFAVVPNGVDTEYFAPSMRHATHDAVFVGGTTWFPNRDALDYFASAILPRVRERRPGFKVKWVGRSTAEEQQRYGTGSGIELTGYVEDIRPHVQASRCYIAPIRSGGGTRLKILDAWAMGMAVVTTTAGAMGLAAEDGVNLLIRDDADSFAQAIEDVLTEPGLQARLGSAGRKVAVEQYGWPVIGRQLDQLYLELLRNQG
jgi:glycosyltransferase involved in cell wall biosynthesis